MAKSNKNSRAVTPPALSVATGSALSWDIISEEGGLTQTLEAVGGVDLYGGELYYRVKRETRLRGDAWIEASSPELMKDENKPMEWPSLFAALEQMQNMHDEITVDKPRSEAEEWREEAIRMRQEWNRKGAIAAELVDALVRLRDTTSCTEGQFAIIDEALKPRS